MQHCRHLHPCSLVQTLAHRYQFLDSIVAYIRIISKIKKICPLFLNQCGNFYNFEKFPVFI